MSADRTTLKALTAKVKIESQYGAVPDARILHDWHRTAHNYRVTLTYQRRRMSLDFFMGSAHTNEPDAEGVIDCLLSDASSAGEYFHDFCREFGYDEDSRKAFATYKACVSNAKKLRRLLGADFDTFMQSERG